MSNKCRELAKAFDELAQMGAVEVKTAQEAVRLQKYAQSLGMAVCLRGQPGRWKVYDISQPMGEVV